LLSLILLTDKPPLKICLHGGGNNVLIKDSKQRLTWDVWSNMFTELLASG